MTASIPASAIVNVVPNVIGAGGTGLDLTGLILTNSARVPIGSVMAFSTAATVATFFGVSSQEAALATTYFGGFDNANISPASLLFAQYPAAAVAPYLRGGAASSLTLTQLQALSGTLTLTINGVVVTSGSINLSPATSFSNAATLIQAGLASYDAVVTGSIAGTTLTVSAVTSGTLAVGQVVSGAGVTAGTKITAFLTGTGGVGTYTVDTSQTLSSTTISAGQTLVTYDSVSGAFIVTGGTPGATGTISFASGTLSASIFLTQATGAVLSQGAVAGVPGDAMAAIVAETQDFVSFATAFKPTVDDMVAFSAWTNGQKNRFLYVMWDNDITVTSNSDTASAGYLIGQASYSGTAPIYDPANGASVAAFVMGSIAAMDFTQADGRTTLAFRAQSGLTPGVTNQAIADNLLANGYNFYGRYATANDQFVFLYPGSVTGPFAWIDSYVNQVWMNNAFQLALMTLLTSIKSIPYNAAGYALIEQAMADPINAAVSFGAIRAGVTLSALQAAEVNAAAGVKVDDVIQQRGWYLSVLDASPQVRAARGSPPVTFFYTDGQSIQKISLASVEIQ